MKTKVITVVRVLLVIVFVVSLSSTICQMRDYQKGNQEYSEAESLAQLHQQFETSPQSDLETSKNIGSDTESVPESEAEYEKETVPEAEVESEVESVSELEGKEDPYATKLAQMDLATLQEVNNDVLGWIEIPNTEVSYPLLQADDNQYYLEHTWKKEANSVGAIFLECQSNPDLSGFNTIIYGHNMRNGSMFGSLKRYHDFSYWEEHPSIYIMNEDGVYRYDIFAAFEVGIKKITYGVNIEELNLKQEFIDFSLKQSVIDTDIVPTIKDHIITLSTCTGKGYDTRWVVQAVLHKTNVLYADSKVEYK